MEVGETTSSCTEAALQVPTGRMAEGYYPHPLRQLIKQLPEFMRSNICLALSKSSPVTTSDLLTVTLRRKMLCPMWGMSSEPIYL